MCDKCERLEKINAILVRALQRQKVRAIPPVSGGAPSATPGAKHTPGPWHLGELGDTAAYIWGPGENEPFIAEVSQEDVSSAEHEANARLIVAAPDLLEACRYALSQMDPYVVDATPLSAAIAKAAGGTLPPVSGGSPGLPGGEGCPRCGNVIVFPGTYWECGSCGATAEYDGDDDPMTFPRPMTQEEGLEAWRAAWELYRQQRDGGR